TRCLSDWSSDVCSSDLSTNQARASGRPVVDLANRNMLLQPLRRVYLLARDKGSAGFPAHYPEPLFGQRFPSGMVRAPRHSAEAEIGRASCRERGEMSRD